MSKFSRWILKYVRFLFLPENMIWQFHANCFLNFMTICMKCQILFSGKNKNILKCHLLNDINAKGFMYESPFVRSNLLDYHGMKAYQHTWFLKLKYKVLGHWKCHPLKFLPSMQSVSKQVFTFFTKLVLKFEQLHFTDYWCV